MAPSMSAIEYMAGTNAGTYATAVFALLIVCIGYILYKMMGIVPAHTVCVVERFGGNPRVLQPGPRLFGLPFIDTVRPYKMTVRESSRNTRVQSSAYIPTREISYDIEPLKVTCADSVPTTVDVTMYIRIVDPLAFLYTFPDPGVFISDVTRSVFATSLADLPASELVGSPKDLPKRLRDCVAPELAPCGVAVSRVLVQRVSVPEAISKALTSVAEGRARADAGIAKARADAKIEAAQAMERRALAEKEAEWERRMELEAAKARGAVLEEVATRRARAAFAGLAEEFGGGTLSPEQRCAHLAELARIAALEKLYDSIAEGKTAGSQGSVVVVPYGGAGSSTPPGAGVHVHTAAAAAAAAVPAQKR